MKLRLLLIFLTATFFTELSAQIPQAKEIGHWSNDAEIIPGIFGRYNEVWGFVQNGEEYAVIGSTKGTHFIQLDHPDGPTEVAYVEGADNSVLHRDYHNYQHYLYAVADEGASTLQVIDYSNLPNSVEVVLDTNEWFQREHNIFIDEANARLYTTSAQILSLADPANPVKIGSAGTFGSHDVFVRDNVAIYNLGGGGMAAYDCSDAANPKFLGDLSGYPNQGYNHAGWMTDDSKHYILCDETGGAFVKMVSTEDLSEMLVIDLFKADNDNPQHIAHNVMIKGDLAYISYYSDGLWVFDISDPENVIPRFHYDTYPGEDNSGFLGAWGIYSFLPSGRLLVSDMQTGLYLIEEPTDDLGIVMNQFSTVGCMTVDKISLTAKIGADFDASTFSLDAVIDPPIADVTFVGDATPGNTFTVEISNFQMPGDAVLTLNGGDNTNSGSSEFRMSLKNVPDQINLALPLNEAIVNSNVISFSWTDESFNASMGYTLELSTTESFTDLLPVIHSSSTTDGLAGPLEPNTTYYWRVIGDNDCGEYTTETFTFSTPGTSGLSELEEENITIFPNPVVNDEFVIRHSLDINSVIDFKLINNLGQVQQGQRELTFPFSVSTKDLSKGIYYLQLFKNESLFTVKKVIIAE